MAKKPPAAAPAPVVDETPVEVAPALETPEVAAPAPAPVAIPVVEQPTVPVGLPTGNPWDLAYPLGHIPPTLPQTGGDATIHGPGYVGEQADTAPNESYTVAGVAPLIEEK